MNSVEGGVHLDGERYSGPNPTLGLTQTLTLHSRTLLLLGLPGGSGPGDVRPSSSHLAAEAGPLLVCQWGVDMTLVRARP